MKVAKNNQHDFYAIWADIKISGKSIALYYTDIEDYTTWAMRAHIKN